MTEFLVRTFIKDYRQTEKPAVRAAYGVLSGFVGIFCNLLLFGAKMAVGVLTNSVSVTADGFNNLSDAGSSVISLAGIRIAQRPADMRHPFGHGRAEYISALIVSFLVLEVGFSSFQDSLSRIWKPGALHFQIVPMLILAASVLVKLWMGLFNRKLGRKIDSKVLEAVFADSVSDALTTGAAIFSLVLFHFTGINVDGFTGMAVALIVMWAGAGIAKETLEPLIGEAADPALYESIERFVESYDGIIGSHDLMVHDYGPGRSMASIHAEVPNSDSLEKAHSIVDRIERDAQEKLGIDLVIHIDPIETRDEQVIQVRRKLEGIVKELAPDCSVHDFRMVKGTPRTNLLFDLVVPFQYDDRKKQELVWKLEQRMKRENPAYHCVVTLDHGYERQEMKK